MGKATGLRITRLFTKPGEDPFDSVTWGTRDSRITNPDGSVVFEMKDAEVPTSWSQVAADIMVSKYLRKAGVPQFDESGEPIRDEEGRIVLGPERSARQVIKRLTSTWRWWGERSGYFASEADAHAFEDELSYMLVNQMAAPNSPQWFNTGLHHAYGLTGPAQGFWYVDPATGRAVPSPDSYSRPAPHACFIQSIEDDLVNEGGIMDLWVREARLFKFGAGTGTNFSRIRAENESLSGGGRSSGVMSFLRIGDRAAGAIKSGGTTRRAAKMVILDIDHPDIEEFINWKKGEEEKVRALIAAGYPSDFNGEAYQTVAGQNANNSVRVSNEFVRAVLDDTDWHLTARTTGRVMRTVPARRLWREIAEAAWACADPGVQFHTTINEWHTCPADGPIRASNPCSEYMFLDNTACNLASLNLGSFFDDDSGTFNIETYQHAIRLWTMVLDVSVTMAHFPSREIAQGSYDYRTLGLGYANLGSLLMRSGIAYDSDEGRAIAAALTALLTGVAYATSAEMASVLGPFPRFPENRTDMLRVIRNHRRAAYDSPQEEYEGVSHRVVGTDPLYCPGALLEAAQRAWDSALDLGEQYGYRNAQTTCLAPTGTIGLQMDCDTTGVEPDFALVKFKKLAGGGYFKIANQSIDPALRSLGYSAEERSEIVRYVVGTMALEGAPHVNRSALVSLGLTDGEVDAVERALPGVFELRYAFSPYVIGEDALARLGVGEAAWKQPAFDLLRYLGFTDEQIREAGDHICGRQTIEG
ncbi:MAG: ribonucleoside-diphosphate reductase, adenosylcobalamin-dependent, partial [Actinobacteria bacterium RBG_16_70_17]